MVKFSVVLRIFLLLMAAGGASAQAWWDDWEVETFTRYRIDNFDNNNNGYVDTSNDAASVNRAESVVLADEISEQAVMPGMDTPFLLEYAAIQVNDILPGGINVPIYANTVVLDRHTGFLSFETGSPFDFIHVNANISLSPSGHETATIPQYTFWNVAVWDDNFGAYRIDFGPDRTRSYSQSRGVTLEEGIRIKPHFETEFLQAVDSSWEISYGASYRNNADDLFMWGDYQGIYNNQGVFSNNYSRLESDTDLWSDSVGPHVGLAWTGRYKRWEWQLGGQAFYAFQFSQGQNQSHALTPFLVSDDSLLQYSSSSRYLSQQNAWLGDVRAQATRQIARNMAVSLGYVNYYLGEIRSAASATQIENNGASVHHVRGTNVTVGMAYLQFALEW